MQKYSSKQIVPDLKHEASEGKPLEQEVALAHSRSTFQPLPYPTKGMSANEIKADYKHFYDTVSAQLNNTIFGPFSYFLNYGYVSNGEKEFAIADLPMHYLNRNSVKLVLEVVGDCSIDEKRVVDVGCGRGGTLHVLKTFFQPATMIGLDLSTNAIEFCKNTHGSVNTAFFQGDAEDLPFQDSTADVVTNVESSHSYPNIKQFYLEVYRVLSSGGYFLYADLMPQNQLAISLDWLRDIGFQMERDRDITANVIRSCDEIASMRTDAFSPGNDHQLLDNFLAVPGSEVYEKMSSRQITYHIWKLRKCT